MSRALLISLSLWLAGLLTVPAQTPSAQQTDESTGIEGTILVSPNQGGPTRAGQSDSSPLPSTAFEVQQNGRVVREFQTDDQGHFRVFLPPGHYTVSRKNPQAIGSYGPFEVDVATGKMSSVNWKCDSGLR